MKKYENVEIQEKVQEKTCRNCFGSTKDLRQACEFCEGKGIYKEKHYMLIAKNGKEIIAFDMDTLK